MGRDDKADEPPIDGEETFLARWSRRKSDLQHEEPGAAADSTDAVIQPEQATDQEPVLTDEDMQPIDSLNSDSDYAPFLSSGVSDDLRLQALRKLFNQPEFNINDGLNDYDEDFTQLPGLGNLVTHEMKRMLKRELEAEKPAVQSPDECAGEVEADTLPVADVTAAVETGDTDSVAPLTGKDEPGTEDEQQG